MRTTTIEFDDVVDDRFGGKAWGLAELTRLGHAVPTGFVVTGPVWEYFADHERLFRPMLRATPFAEHDAVRFRQQLVSRDIDFHAYSPRAAARPGREG